MKAHILHKVYSNGVSNVWDVFSSAKKAQAELDYILKSAKEDHNYEWRAWIPVNGITCYKIFFSGDKNVHTDNDMMYYIESREIR